MSSSAESMEKLKELAFASAETIHERVVLARNVMDDIPWIDATFGGDKDRAMNAIEKDCFPGISMVFSLSLLLTLLREFPDIEQWRKYRFNITRIWAEHQTNIANERKRRRPILVARSPKVPVHRPHAQNKELCLEEAEEEIEMLKKENSKLRAELDLLRAGKAKNN